MLLSYTDFEGKIGKCALRHFQICLPPPPPPLRPVRYCPTVCKMTNMRPDIDIRYFCLRKTLLLGHSLLYISYTTLKLALC